MTRYQEDKGLTVARYNSYCCFCSRPTKAKQSITWIRVERTPSGALSHKRKVGHFECYGSGADHLLNYSKRDNN